MSLDTFSKIKYAPENSVNVFVEVGLCLRAIEELDGAKHGRAVPSWMKCRFKQ